MADGGQLVEKGERRHDGDHEVDHDPAVAAVNWERPDVMRTSSSPDSSRERPDATGCRVSCPVRGPEGLPSFASDVRGYVGKAAHSLLPSRAVSEALIEVSSEGSASSSKRHTRRRSVKAGERELT